MAYGEQSARTTASTTTPTFCARSLATSEVARPARGGERSDPGPALYISITCDVSATKPIYRSARCMSSLDTLDTIAPDIDMMQRFRALTMVRSLLICLFLIPTYV